MILKLVTTGYRQDEHTFNHIFNSICIAQFCLYLVRCVEDQLVSLGYFLLFGQFGFTFPHVH